MASIRPLFRLGHVLVLTIFVPTVAAGQQIPSPESFFGFQMGADRKLARWDKMVEYYDLLGEQSPRIEVVHMGPSTLGNPFLALFISAPENLARLEQLKRLNVTLADPRGVPDSAIERAIANGRAVVVQSMGLHASEVAASQMAVEVVYDMATRNDDEMLRILNNAIAVMIPCFNPDGQIMITDWYDEWLGTEYEGVNMPWLYHHYIGHDNNRDAFMRNTIESFYGAELIFREWMPQAYVDHHQMGAYGARLYVPPYAEPIRPDGDPLVWREMSWYGAHIAYKEEEAGISGVVNAAMYSGWGHFGFHWITPFHNIAGMLTESASARLATPLFVHPDQLQGSPRGLPEYRAQTTFPDPWPGGWWRVRDIIDQQKVATIAVLDMAARNRETVLRNAYLKAMRQTQRGAEGKPAAFVIPATQHDPLTMQKMVNKLLGQGIEVQQASADFTHAGRIYRAGTYVVSMAQPKRGVIRWLLGRTFYPDNDFTRARDGSPMRPYDMSTDNIAEYMGVQVDPVDTWVETDLSIVADTLDPIGVVARGQFGYMIDGRLNDSFKAANLLWNEGVALRRVSEATDQLQPGDFLVPGSADDALIARVADETGVDLNPLEIDASPLSNPVSQPRIGMYQRYLGGNMDEGWTRLLLERFAFPYTSILDEELKAGNLNRNYDVIILPDDDARTMTGESGDGEAAASYFATGREAYPPEYRSGFGQQGVAALETFVANGGTLVTFARAGDLPIQEFGLPIRNVVADVPSTEFWSPGSTLRMNVDNTNPIGYGMPEEALGLFVQGNHAYQINPSARNEAIERIATFVERDIMQSGWLIGEDHIAEKAAVVSVGYGDGKVVLISFRAQHRMQTHGTFKFLFNSLVDAAAERP